MVSCSRRDVHLSARVEASARALPRLLAALTQRDVEVRAASSTQPTLDDVFLNLTGRSLREGEE